MGCESLKSMLHFEFEERADPNSVFLDFHCCQSLSRGFLRVWTERRSAGCAPALVVALGAKLCSLQVHDEHVPNARNNPNQYGQSVRRSTQG